MASVHQAAAKRKVKKKYKGKYPGPDKWKGKGDPAKRKAAKKPAAKKPAAKPAPKPVSPNLGTGVGVTTDSNGNLKLQTNYEIEKMALDAAQEQQTANEQATAMEQESLLSESENKRSALNVDVENRTRSAGRMAARGMRGSAAVAAQAEIKSAYGENLNRISTRRQQEHQTSANMITSAAARRKQRDAQIALARKDWTDQQSKANPTVGSTPVNSGVKPPTATPVATRPKPKPKPKPKKKPYKGKRPGPG